MKFVKVFCYSPQSEDVMKFFRGLDVGHVAVSAITNPNQLEGVEDITFIHVKNSGEPVPQPLYEKFLARGTTLVEISNLRRAR